MDEEGLKEDRRTYRLLSKGVRQLRSPTYCAELAALNPDGLKVMRALAALTGVDVTPVAYEPAYQRKEMRAQARAYAVLALADEAAEDPPMKNDEGG